GHTASSNSSPWRIRDSAGSTPDLRRHCGGPGSDTDPGPALPPPGGQDRAACPGPHAQPETMRLGAVAVVRLERALTHRRLHLRFITGLTVHHRRAVREARPPEARRPGKLGSVHGMRMGNHRSNQWRRSNRIYRSYPKQERPFAERGVAYNHRLWTTGHAARERGGAGRLRSGPAAPGYGPECGVHSLWI